VQWNIVTGKRGPQAFPSPMNASNVEARESLRHLGGVQAKITLPGHGDPWHGPPATLVERALAAT
jgi:hypothetical protein